MSDDTDRLNKAMAEIEADVEGVYYTRETPWAVLFVTEIKRLRIENKRLHEQVALLTGQTLASFPKETQMTLPERQEGETKEPSVVQIYACKGPLSLKEWLEKYGYAGLAIDADCCCSTDDLGPCGGVCDECRAVKELFELA